MRMFYNFADDDEYEAGRDLLVERLERWAALQGGPREELDAFAVAVALDYRHSGTRDGRLGLWEPRHIEEFLLNWAPRAVTVLPGEQLPDAPGAVRWLLRFLHATQLADPRGPGLEEQLVSVDAAAHEYPAAMADRSLFGPAKFWITLAAEHGIDLSNQSALDGFVERVHAGEQPHDEDALRVIAQRHITEGPADGQRSEPQLPVILPSAQTLRAQARHIALLTQVRQLAEWAGKQGRAVTATGRLKTADARELVDLLATGDALPKALRSGDDLPRLSLVFELAKAARVVRVTKGRLYAVAKATRDLKDPLALWRRTFDALFAMRRPLLGAKSGWHVESMLFDTYEDVLPDILATLYSLPHPMPWPRLRDSVDHSHRVRFQLGDEAHQTWFDHAHRDLRHVLDVLEDFGAIDRTRGTAAHEYLDMPVPSRAPALPPGMPAELAALLGDQPPAPVFTSDELTDAPTELISLTALGTWAMRARLLAEGRDAPLVGELADAPAAGLLGVLAEHYDTDSARAELTTWLQAHGGEDSAYPHLLDAVRNMPFRSRAQAMLNTLLTALPEPEGKRLVRSLRTDPRLAPYAIGTLVQRGLLSLADLTDTEALVMVAEGMLQLLEATGPDGFAEAMLAQGPDFQTAVEAALAAPHPDQTALSKLQESAARLPRPLSPRGGQHTSSKSARTRHSEKKRRRDRRR
ncbi:hypothetical protein [Streptomyces sp. RPT161]|uniref:hypothetical protein n=1 Tax=Streptomyces sp. RPT161 TaxID=3015993 RepID=UPI0022B8DD2E|nr:hypothetical protein [Streptomyces sp. RPT161]